MKEEKGNRPKLSDNLEEAVEKHINEALFKWSYDDEDGIEQYVYDAFIAGAKWQKGQMMGQSFAAYKLGLKDALEVLEEGAIEGEVVKDIYGQYHVKSEAIEGCELPFGAKVKIIIIKEQ